MIFRNNQVDDIYYNETFAPKAKTVTVQTFLVIAAIKNWELHQMDVHNTFLYGDLDEEFYIEIPFSFVSSTPSKVSRLQKSLYGL